MSELPGQSRRVTASVGVISLATAERAGRAPMVLADMLMYQAKSDGRNQAASVDDEAPELPRMARHLALRERIEHALINGGFELYLQPIADVRTGEVVSAEALLRLRDGGPEVSPAEFIPVTERTGLSMQIDLWVVREALGILGRLQQARPGFTLSANVSAPSVGSDDYLVALRSALAESTVADPSTFTLEITETAAVTDMERAGAFTRAVSECGVGLALDDFGAGFGSFAYLKELSFDCIKLDGSFIENVETSQIDQSLVSAMVQLARNLGKRTVAEYVSSAAGMATIESLGVDLAQGYFVGRPVPVTAFIESLFDPRGQETS